MLYDKGLDYSLDHNKERCNIVIGQERYIYVLQQV